MTDLLINNFYGLQKKYVYLQSIQLFRSTQNDNCSELTLQIFLTEDTTFEKEKMEITFHNVKDIKFGNVGGLFQMSITITDVSKYQMEKIKFKISEEENLSFSFYCESFSYKLT